MEHKEENFMKSVMKLSGIITIALVIGFLIAVCGKIDDRTTTPDTITKMVGYE